jgi:hypothetical protein
VPANNFLGPDSLSLTLADAGDGLSSPKTSVALSVVSQPTLTAPPVVTTTEDVGYRFPSGALVLADASATGTSDTFALKVSDGILQLGSNSGITILSGGSPGLSMTAQGSAAALAAALNGLTYTPNVGYIGSDQLTLLYTDSTDGLTAPASVVITVNSPTSLQPTVAASSNVSVTENSAPGFTFSGNSGITIADSQVSGSSDSVSLSVASGTLMLSTTSGLNFTAGANDASSMTFSGPLTNLNAALSGLEYTPARGFFGNDALVISVADSGSSLSGASVVVLNVQPLAPPTIGAPIGISLLQNTASGPILVTFNEPDPGATTEAFTLSASHGTLTLHSTAGLSVEGNGSSSIVMTGPLDSLTNALNGVVYAPPTGYYGPDTIAYSMFNPDDNRFATAVTLVTVVGSPLVTAPPTPAVNENGSNIFIGPISLTDDAAGNPSESVTLTVSHGILTFASTTGLSFGTTSNNSSSITVTGTLSSVNAALAGLYYTPATLWIGGDTLQISLTDAETTPASPRIRRTRSRVLSA